MEKGSKESWFLLNKGIPSCISAIIFDAANIYNLF